MKKSTRKIKANETLDIIKNGFYIDENQCKIDISKQLQFTIENTKLYNSKDLDVLINDITLEENFETVFEVTNEDSVSSILRVSEKNNESIMCLNFASAKNPGGGFLNGAKAQEESLAISSALYASQLKAFEYYEIHRGMKSCIYTDTMIHSPNVPVFRNKNGNLIIESAACSIITSSAVNLGVVKRFEQEILPQVEYIMNLRIEKMLSICVEQKHKILILGAWGCGVFQNDPNLIAKLFHIQLNTKFKNQFKKVVFAIYSRNEKFINAFNELF